MDDGEFVKIAVLDSMIEAQLISSMLTEDGIPHLMKSYHDTAYNGLFQFQKGWGEVCAPEHYQSVIRSMIEHVRLDKDNLSESSYFLDE